MGGADYQWTLGPEPSGSGWCFLGDSDDPEAAEKELQRIFAESAEILEEKEEDRRKAEEDWANERIDEETDAFLAEDPVYSGQPIRLQKFTKDGWKKE